MEFQIFKICQNSKFITFLFPRLTIGLRMTRAKNSRCLGNTTTMNRVQILRTVQQVRQWRKQRLLNNESVGFVPTMGALHAGHCYLVNQSIKDNDRTVVSIFVNPSQFAPHEDLDAYPRLVDRDLAMLAEKFPKKPVDAVFVPKVSEMYPSGIVLDVAQQRGAFVLVKGCSETLEGALRPGFFRGVATVVTKLLNVVMPTRVYFGQKDAQQCVVVRNLVRDLLVDTEVCVMPTLREDNGLAMLSRNEYLSPATRDQCGIIYRGLCAGRDYYLQGGSSAQAVKDEIVRVYAEMPSDWLIDYVAVSHPETLEDLHELDPAVGATVSVAVRVPRDDGGVARLIDNVQLEARGE